MSMALILIMPLLLTKAAMEIRKFLESWHTTSTPSADNNYCPFPGQHNILFNNNILKFIPLPYSTVFYCFFYHTMF